MNNYFMIYNTATNVLYKDGVAVTNYTHKTCSGEHLKFDVTPTGLKWNVSFFLLDNIFYFHEGEFIYFTRHIDDLKTLAKADAQANAMLHKYGFLPHARTQFTNVNIVCSFLSYAADPKGVSISASYPEITSEGVFTVDDLMDALRKAFKQQIERVNQERWILPLSGGMDSRLLLSIALDCKDIDLHLYTVGTRDCGDIRVAKAISKSLRMESRHKIQYLEDFSLDDLLTNYKACDYLVPLDRILTKPLNYFFEKGAVISGLYGDVIFSDNTNSYSTYQDYYNSEGFSLHDSVDRSIVAAYNTLPKLPKIQRIALRCQKLTRQSFPLNEGFDFVTPFVNPDVLICASNVKSKSLYSELVDRHMRPDLKRFIHQSTLSYFTHPTLLRTIERKLFKLIGHPARRPYFNNALLHRLGIKRNEAPSI